MQKRRQIIFEKIKEAKIGINDLLSFVNKKNSKKVSKITVIRDLDELIKNNSIVRLGKGPAVKYQVSPAYKIFEDVDVDAYFLNDLESRNAKKDFDFAIFDLLKREDLFTDSQMDELKKMNDVYQKNIRSLPQEIIKKEFERLMIELSWKSSKIEGNTYDLLETEFLIKENKYAKGHTRLEAQMILNHKDALWFIQKKRVNIISQKSLVELHKVIVKDMNVSTDVRTVPVGITGTIYRPMHGEDDIKKALLGICDLINFKENIFEKSLLLNLLIAYLQPFADGNKRTSRLSGNAILMSNDYCPLSFRSIDELEYKKAIILFYEQNNLSYFRKLFIEQYSFAVENYFRGK